MDGVGNNIHKKNVVGSTYRLIPSHFPPIELFENLLDPQELKAAYALECLTNDRLQDEVGNISLVAPENRVTGPGTTAIMAAFTHVGVPSRFTNGRYGVYYAGLDIETAMAESKFSRARFMMATNESAQVLTMRCYQFRVNASLVDVSDDQKVHEPDNFNYAQALAEQLRRDNELGILYDSVRYPGGQCIAALRPSALTPPATQAGHYQFHWDGNAITHVLSIASTL
jgi:hypothetical protein